MTISRRDLLVYGAGFGAALPLIGTISPALADGDGGGDGGGGNGGDGNAYRNEAARRFAAFVTVLQCSRVPELPLITGDNAVNAGIRYDDEMAAWTGVSKWTLQRAARVGDIEHRMNPGVLPMFTIGAMISGDTNPQTKPFIHFELALNYLTEVCGLPRESLSFTTTDVASQTFAESLLNRVSLASHRRLSRTACPPAASPTAPMRRLWPRAMARAGSSTRGTKLAFPPCRSSSRATA